MEMDNRTAPGEPCSYEYDAPVEERERLFGRDVEWKAIEGLLKSGQGGLVLLIGGPRSGKTSFFRTLHNTFERWIKAPDHFQVISHYTSLPDLVPDSESQAVKLQLSEVFAAYESGVVELLRRLGQDNPYCSAAQTFQQRLRENIAGTVYGDDSSRQANRAQILDGLNQLTMSQLGVAFDELCNLTSPISRQEPRLHSIRLCEGLILELRERAKELLKVCSIDPDMLSYKQGQELPDYFGKIFHRLYEACAANVPKRNFTKLVLLIDEADRLLVQPCWPDFLTAMRVMFAPELKLRDKLVIMMAGGQRLHQVTNQTEVLDILSSSLMLNPIFLDNLPVEAVRNIAKELDSARELNTELVANLHHLAGGQPYLTKYMMRMTEGVEPGAINRTAQTLVERDTKLREMFDGWNASCGDEGQQVYRQLLESEKLSRRGIKQKVKLADPSRLGPILNLLCCYGMVRRIAGDEEDYYQVAGEMFAYWFRDTYDVS